tara:strand:+ start:788 stop:1060 length:273 start_codon:yes stop_codon:yes gene_type:complete
MATEKYVISETGEFPAQYKVLELGDNGIYVPVFGPDPDINESLRKCSEMNKGKIEVEEPDNDSPKPKKAPVKKKAPAAKKAPAKKAAKKK